jgi:hypothetical protein
MKFKMAAIHKFILTMGEVFFEKTRFFFKNSWHFQDIFRKFEAFLKISILYEDIFREIEAFLRFLKNCEAFKINF